MRDVVQCGRDHGVTVCLENLSWEAKSGAAVFIDPSECPEAGVTFDMGHASSNEAARAGFSSERFAGPVSAHVRNRPLGSTDLVTHGFA